jgi:hypothetical protein
MCTFQALVSDFYSTQTFRQVSALLVIAVDLKLDPEVGSLRFPTNIMMEE